MRLLHAAEDGLTPRYHKEVGKAGREKKRNWTKLYPSSMRYNTHFPPSQRGQCCSPWSIALQARLSDWSYERMVESRKWFVFELPAAVGLGGPGEFYIFICVSTLATYKGGSNQRTKTPWNRLNTSWYVAKPSTSRYLPAFWGGKSRNPACGAG